MFIVLKLNIAMKKFRFVALMYYTALVWFAFGLSACAGSGQQSAQQEKADTAAVALHALSVEEVLSLDTLRLGQPVEVEGDVEHVCKRSGMRCFLAGRENVDLRVEAGGEIESFASDLIGHRIRVKGVLRGQEIPAAKIAEIERAVAEQEASGESEGHCDAQRQTIARWRKWMDAAGKDFYLLYYVEGESYEVVEQ